MYCIFNINLTFNELIRILTLTASYADSGARYPCPFLLYFSITPVLLLQRQENTVQYDIIINKHLHFHQKSYQRFIYQFFLTL